MNVKMGNFNIPIASVSVLGALGILILIPFMEKLVYPLLAKFDKRPSKLQRIGAGMLISTASMACAGGIEWYRVEQCCSLQDRGNTHLTNVSSITILYQIPQYTLQGLSEVLVFITGEYCLSDYKFTFPFFFNTFFFPIQPTSSSRSPSFLTSFRLAFRLAFLPFFFPSFYS